MSFEELRDGVLHLPESQRIELVELLLETLPEQPTGLSMEDPGFYDELDRRMADEGGWKTWEEVRDV